MLLAVSRLMFAWAEDGVFPAVVARVHPRWATPHVALLASGAVASLSILGSHLASDFFLGVDILVTSMLVNFLLMCASVLALPHTNPEIAGDHRAALPRPADSPGCPRPLRTGRPACRPCLPGPRGSGRALGFAIDVGLVMVMAVASLIYGLEVRKLRRQGLDLDAHFKALPVE